AVDQVLRLRRTGNPFGFACDLRAGAQIDGHDGRVAHVAVDPGRRQDRQSPGVDPQAFPDLAADDDSVAYDPRIPADVCGHVNFSSGHEQVAADADWLRTVDFPSRGGAVGAGGAD